MSFTPLAGLRVVDVTTSFAGPFCTEILGALGAEVVKIEAPEGGDEARSWGPPFFEGTSAMFLTANANKRSVAIELRRGRSIVERLVRDADVFIQSLRPGLAAERGLAESDLRPANERLVYCSIGGFGTAGPLAGRPGYDPLAQAASGLISVTGEAGGPGVRVGVSVIDQSTGIWAALAILAALTGRAAGGPGATIDLSLYETAISLMGYQLSGFLSSGVVPGRHGTAFPSIAPYQAFAASDGPLLVAVGSDRIFRAFAAAIGAEELATDGRFETNADRVAHRDALNAEIEPRIARRTRERWLETFAGANVPAAPIHDVRETAEHSQTRALGILQPLGGLPIANLPFSIDGERPPHRSPAPALGADTDAVLREAGYDDAEIAELEEQGIIARAT